MLFTGKGITNLGHNSTSLVLTCGRRIHTVEGAELSVRDMILRMRKIAVVDDNADNRLIIRTILEDQYEVMEFSSGIEAIDGFRKDKPDIVILDISLPELDGTEILRRIRDDSELHALPVVALTAHAMVGDREKYLAAGFNDYIAKPILDMNILFSTIQRWVPGT